MARNRTESESPIDEIRAAEAAEDLAAILEDWGAIGDDFDHIRMDADFEF